MKTIKFVAAVVIAIKLGVFAVGYSMDQVKEGAEKRHQAIMELTSK